MFMQLSLEVNKKESGMRAYSAGAEERQGFGERPSGSVIRAFETENRGREDQLVLLRHVPTGFYYRNRQEWVMAPADAMSFSGTDEALEVVDAEGLAGVCIVPRPENCGIEWVFALSRGIGDQTGTQTIQ